MNLNKRVKTFKENYLKKITIKKNDKFGFLTVLDVISGMNILCKCVCGKVKSYKASRILSAHSKSCGCSKGLTIKQTNQKKYGVNSTAQIKEVKNKQIDTLIRRYGANNPMKVEAFATKAMKTSSTKVMRHWKTKKNIYCCGSYEEKVVEWLNSNKIDYDWQIHFNLSKDETYRIDLFLKKENKFVEIKGLWRKEARKKYDLFKSIYPNTEVWDRKRLKELGIKIS